MFVAVFKNKKQNTEKSFLMFFLFSWWVYYVKWLKGKPLLQRQKKLFVKIFLLKREFDSGSGWTLKVCITHASQRY